MSNDKKTHLRDLQLTLPGGEVETGGPCTPTYEFPVSLPPPRHAPSTPDVSGLSLGHAITPSPQVTGKRSREEDQWDPQEVEVLQNVLDRPPKEALFPPGSMPPPHVLDELTSAVVQQIGSGRATQPATEGDAPVSSDTVCRDSTADDPMDDTSTDVSASSCTSHASSPEPEDPSSRPIAPWPHSWEETRRMLTALALADTRLGHELADRKLSRQERLSRPGVRRVDSMDFLDRSGSETPPSEKLGRALRLSTKLQNSAREVPELARAASGPATGSRSGTASNSSRSTPPVSFNRAFGKTLTPTGSDARPAPIRSNSARSDKSERRPSLLARGRSFTASDLEAEFEAEEGANQQSTRLVVSAPISNVASATNMTLSPKTAAAKDAFTNASALGLGLDGMETLMSTGESEPESHSRRRSSAPDSSTRLARSHSYSAKSRREPRYESRGTSHDFSGRGREMLGLGLPPAPTHGQGPSALGAAFDPTASSSNAASGGGEWDSDSDREGYVSVKRRARRPQLAMTAMVGSPVPGTDTGGAGIDPGPGTATPPKLVIDSEMDVDGPGLRSPFEERPTLD